MLHTIRGGKSPQTSPNRAPADLAPLTNSGQVVSPSADHLTDALADTERMASILSTLLNDRIVDTGNRRQLQIGRQDAEDIRFAAGQLLAMLARTGDVWRAIP